MCSFLLMASFLGCNQQKNNILAPGRNRYFYTTIPIEERGPLRITEVEIPGVPKENIRISDSLNTINITLPRGFSTPKFKPVFKAVCKECYIEERTFETIDLGGSYYPRVTVYYGKIEYIGDDYLIEYRKHRKEYKLNFIAGDSMRIAGSPNPIHTKVGDTGFLIKISDYYESERNARVILTRKDTGKKTEHYLDRHDAKGIEADSAGFNIFSVSAGDLYLGEYAIEVIKNNGRKATTSVSVVVEKGIPFAFHVTRLVEPGQRAIIFGGNLFEGDGIELKVTDRTGTVTTLPIVEYDAYDGKGAGVKVQVPPSLQAGHYIAWLTKAGNLVGKVNYTFHPFYVQGQDLNRPFFAHFGEGIETNDVTQPYILKRETIYNLSYAPAGKNARLKWVSIANPATSIFTNPAISTDYATSEEWGKFSLAKNMPAGKYNVFIQQTQPNGPTRESLPWVRVVEVR